MAARWKVWGLGVSHSPSSAAEEVILGQDSPLSLTFLVCGGRRASIPDLSGNCYAWILLQARPSLPPSPTVSPALGEVTQALQLSSDSQGGEPWAGQDGSLPLSGQFSLQETPAPPSLEGPYRRPLPLGLEGPVTWRDDM